MILDISDLISGRIKSEMKISHFPGKFFVGKQRQIPGKIRNSISKTFGESFLNDANFIVFFKNEKNEYSTKDKKKLLSVIKNAFEDPNTSSMNINELHEVKIESNLHEDDDDDNDDEDTKKSNDTSFIFIKLTTKD